MSAKRTPLLGELHQCLTPVFSPLRPLSSRHRCDLSTRWSHLSTADCHLVRLSSTSSFGICLFTSLSVTSVGLSQRFRSRSLADASWVGWLCRMWPVGMKRPLALSTASQKFFLACSTVLVSPASSRYSSQASE